jgi:hypothetical protein
MERSPKAIQDRRTQTVRIILPVTWIVGGQPPSSYQVEFDSWATCNAARNAVLDDRDQMVKGIGTAEGFHSPGRGALGVLWLAYAS